MKFLYFFVFIFLFFPFVTNAFSGNGAGTLGDPFQITTCVQLQEMVDNKSAHYILMNNIDCSDTVNWNSGAGFLPVGDGFSVAASFSGTFNGNAKVISNLFINRPNTNLIGLFGITYGGHIYDVGLESVNITGAQYTGGLIGHLHWNSGTPIRGTIQRVYTTGTVSGTTRVGGIVGEQSLGDITNSYSHANVEGRSGSWIGGLAGVVSESDTSTSRLATKGISNSYATGNVTTASHNIRGGFSGGDGARISNSFSVGGVTTGGSNGGGFHGRTTASITSNNYWYNHAGNPNTCVGTTVSGTFSCTTITDINHFKNSSNAPLTSWDFVNTWSVDGVNNDGFPYLQWQSFADIIPPTILSVSSNKANGSYTVGEVIDIDVTFSEAVTSTGDVIVTLETGDTDRICIFTVTNASTGTCDYIVQEGDTTNDLNVLSISGTIVDQSSNAMVNFVPATNLATNKAIVIDTTAPTLTVLSSVPDLGTYTTDAVINIAIRSTEILSLTGTPSVEVLVGESAITFTNYSIGWPEGGGTTLLFSHTVTESNQENTGITINSPLNLNGGSLRDAAGNNAVLTFDSTQIIGVLVNPDVIAPILTVISSPSSNSTIAQARLYFTTNESCTPLAEAPLSSTGPVEIIISETLVDVTNYATISGMQVGGVYSFSFLCRDNGNNSSNLLTFGPVTIIAEPTSPTNTGRNSVGSSVQFRVQNLTTMGNIDAANTLMQQYPHLFAQTASIPTTSNTNSTNVSSTRELQRFLNANGFPVASSGPGSLTNETDTFGELTQQALARFQQSNGISPALGVFGPITRAFINSYSLTPNILPAPTTSSSEISRDLELGMNGADVTKLQEVLIKAGYSISAGRTGYFGQQTKDALIAYQKSNNINPAIGYFGVVTRGSMKEKGMEI